MKIARIAAGAAVLIAVAPTATATEWRVLAMLEQPGPHQLALIDEGSMILKDGILRVWIQQLEADALISVIPTNATPEGKNFEDLAVAKLNAGYMPPLAADAVGRLPAKEVQDLQIAYTTWELAANTFSYKVKSKIFVEIKCDIRTSRVTAVHLYREDGSPWKSADLPDAKFSPIMPGSIFDDSRRWYCK